MIVWRWARFEELSPREVHEALALRQRVFILEQECFYPDADPLDEAAWHLLGHGPGPEGTRPQLLAYLRVLAPGARFEEHSIGRVVVAPEARSRGMGRALMQEGLARVESSFGAVPIRISAQAYLERFYAELGFRAVSEPYLEDGIPHVEMLKGAEPG